MQKFEKPLPYLKHLPDEPHETYLERTIDYIKQAIIEHPEDELQLMQQLLIYMSVDDNHDETINLANKLFEADKEKIFTDDVCHVLARTYAELKDIPKAISYYKEVIKIEPDCDEAIIELADIYKSQSDFENALKTYDYLDNEDIDDGKENMYNYKGTLYYNMREFDKALKCFKNMLKINSEDSDGWITEIIAETYWQKKKYDDSMKWFKMALEKNPLSHNAHYGMGLCYSDTGDYYRAMHHYTEAIKIKPDFARAYNNIAAIAINDESEMQRGIEMLEKALEVEEGNNIKGLIYKNLSNVYTVLCDYDKANYYKAKFIESCGFDVEYQEGEEEDDD